VKNSKDDDNKPAGPRADRPHMPGYGLLAAEEGSGLFDWDHVDERMAAARNYWIASTRLDGRPHVMPVWGIWLDGAFYFGTGRDSVKDRNLSANPAVIVHLESGDDVIILEGTAVVVSDSEILARYADAYEAKYDFRPDPADPGGVTYTLRLRKAMAWLEKDFPGSATRWVFD